MTDINIEDVSHEISIQTPEGFNLEFNGQIVEMNANLSNYYTKGQTDQLLNGKQNTANLVTSLSSASTDVQYPSAKCVYDIIGDVETLLSEV